MKQGEADLKILAKARIGLQKLRNLEMAHFVLLGKADELSSCKLTKHLNPEDPTNKYISSYGRNPYEMQVNAVVAQSMDAEEVLATAKITMQTLVNKMTFLKSLSGKNGNCEGGQGGKGGEKNKNREKMVDNCVICLEEMNISTEETAFLLCGHTFHSSCFKNYVEGEQREDGENKRRPPNKN